MRSVSKKQANINRELVKTYQKIDIEREPICQGCGSGNKPLSHSHTISQKKCKELGKPELISDENNIELECFGTSESCHEKWERAPVKEKSKMLNFEKKMAYLKIHDPQKHTIMKIALK